MKDKAIKISYQAEETFLKLTSKFREAVLQLEYRLEKFKA